MNDKERNTIERLDIFFKVAPYVTDETRKILLNELKLSEDEVTKRGSGKLKEIELELLFLFSKAVDIIIPLGEDLPNLKGEKIPDYLVYFTNGDVAFIEVKSTIKKLKKFVNKNYIEKQEKYAEKLGCKLYYMLNVEGVWMLFDSNKLKNLNNKISIENYKDSILLQTFKFRTYEIKPHFCIEETYNKKNQDDYGKLKIKDDKYGVLERFKLIHNDIKIFDTINLNDEQIEDFIYLDTILNDIVLSMKMNSQIVEQTNDKTVLKYKLKESMAFTPGISFLEACLRSDNQEKLILSIKKVIVDARKYYKDMINDIEDMFELYIKKGDSISECESPQKVELRDISKICYEEDM